MYPRVNYEMTEADHEELMKACQPVPYIVLGGLVPRSQQENANEAWARLGQKMGFDSSTVQPIRGLGTRHFSAVPSETPEQRKDRLAAEALAARAASIARAKQDVEEAQARLAALEATPAP